MARQLLLILSFIAALTMVACGAIRPATTPPSYGEFKNDGGA